MKVVCFVLVLLLVLMEAFEGVPVHSRKLRGWRNLPRTPVSYRERLQSWGLYPKVFRYGTANQHRAATTMAKRKDDLRWMKRLVREHEGQNEMSAEDSNAVDSSNRQLHRQQYERFKEKLLQKMEQDAIEILWQHR